MVQKWLTGYVLYTLLATVFIMEKALELIKQKKEQYREFIRQLGYESTTAKRLGFDTEVQKIENNRKWVMEIIDLLEEVAIKVQSSSNGG